jgi:hypothetical protein
VVAVVAGCAGTTVDLAVLRRCSDASRVRRSPGIGGRDRTSTVEVGTSGGPGGVPRNGGRARLPRSRAYTPPLRKVTSSEPSPVLMSRAPSEDPAHRIDPIHIGGRFAIERFTRPTCFSVQGKEAPGVASWRSVIQRGENRSQESAGLRMWRMSAGGASRGLFTTLPKAGGETRARRSRVPSAPSLSRLPQRQSALRQTAKAYPWLATIDSASEALRHPRRPAPARGGALLGSR